MRKTKNISGYRKKPKSERKPPVWKQEIEIEPLEDILLKIYLNGLRQGGARFVNKRSVAVFVNENKSVTLLMQDHAVRWNSTARKHYFTDDTIAVRTVYLTTRDNIAFYFYNIHNQIGRGNTVKIALRPYDAYNSLVDLFREFDNPLSKWRDIATEKLGRSVSLEAAYPGMHYFGPPGFYVLGTKVMRADTAIECTKLVFGKNHYRKDLVRAVGRNMDPSAGKDRAHKLKWVSLFKGLVPDDWMVEALNISTPALRILEEGYTQRVEEDYVLFRNLMRRLKPAERKNILLHCNSATQGWLMTDTIRTYNLMTHINWWFPDNRENFKSLRDLHDRCATEYTRQSEIARKERMADMYNPRHMLINKDEIHEQFATYVETLAPERGLEIKFARDYETLLNWSNYMSNCISSYFASTVLLGGVYADGKLIANFELDITDIQKDYVRYGLRQLLGRFNQKLDKDLKEQIESYLEIEHNVRLIENRWA